MGFKPRMAIAIIVVLILTLAFFYMRFFDGLTLVMLTPRLLLWTFIIGHVLLIAGVIIGAAISRSSTKDYHNDVIEDERDRLIENRGDKIGYYTLSGLIVIMIVQYMLEQFYPNSVFEAFNLSSAYHFVVALTFAIFFAELIKWLCVFVMYRR